MKKFRYLALLILTIFSCVIFSACGNKYNGLKMTFYSSSETQIESCNFVIEEGKVASKKIGVKFTGINKKDIGQVLIYSSPQEIVTSSPITYDGNMCYTTLTANSATKEGKLVIKHLASNKKASIDLLVEKKSSNLILKNSKSKYVISIPSDGENEHTIDANQLVSINGTDEVLFKFEGTLPIGVTAIYSTLENAKDLITGFKVSSENSITLNNSEIEIVPVTVMQGYENTEYSNKKITIKFAKTLTDEMLSLSSDENRTAYLNDVIHLVANDASLNTINIDVLAENESVESYLDCYNLDVSSTYSGIAPTVIGQNKILVKATMFTDSTETVTISLTPNKCIGEITSASISLKVKGEKRPTGIDILKSGEVLENTSNIELYDTYASSNSLGALFNFKPVALVGGTEYFDVYSGFSKMRLIVNDSVINYGTQVNKNFVYTDQTFTTLLDTSSLSAQHRYVLAIYLYSRPLRFYKVEGSSELLSEPISATDNIYIRYVDLQTGGISDDLSFKITTIYSDAPAIKYLQHITPTKATVSFERKDGVENITVKAGEQIGPSYEIINSEGSVTNLYLDRTKAEESNKYLYLSNDAVIGYLGRIISQVDLTVKVVNDFNAKKSLKLANSQTGGDNWGEENEEIIFNYDYSRENNYIKLAFDETTDVGNYKIVFEQLGTGFRKEINCLVYEGVEETDSDKISILFENNDILIDNKYINDENVLEITYSTYSEADYIVPAKNSLDMEIRLPDGVINSGILKGYSFSFVVGDSETEVENADKYFAVSYDTVNGNIATLNFKNGTFITDVNYIYLTIYVEVNSYSDILTISDESIKIEKEIVFFIYEEVNYSNLSINKTHDVKYMEDYLGYYNKGESNLTLKIDANSSALWNYVTADVVWEVAAVDSLKNAVDSVEGDVLESVKNSQKNFTFKKYSNESNYEVKIIATIKQFNEIYTFICTVEVRKPIISEKVLLKNNISRNASTGNIEINLKQGETFEFNTANSSSLGTVTHPGVVLQVFNKNSGNANNTAVSITNNKITINEIVPNLRVVIFAKDALDCYIPTISSGYNNLSSFLIYDDESAISYDSAYVIVDLMLSDGKTEQTAYLINSANDFWDINRTEAFKSAIYKLNNNVNLSNTTYAGNKYIQDFKGEIYCGEFDESENLNPTNYVISGIVLDNNNINLFKNFYGILKNINFNVQYKYNYRNDSITSDLNLGLIDVLSSYKDKNGVDVYSELLNVSIVMSGSATLNGSANVNFGALVGVNNTRIIYNNLDVVGVSNSIAISGNANVNFGALVGCNNGTIQGVELGTETTESSELETDDTHNVEVDFIVSFNSQGVMADVYITDNLTNETSCVGGLVGFNLGKINNAKVCGTITTINSNGAYVAAHNIGGVVGINENVQQPVFITTGDGKITTLSLQGEIFVENVTSNVKIFARNSNNVGGITGSDTNGVYRYVKYQIVADNERTTSLTHIIANENVGGIIGFGASSQIYYSSVMSYFWDYFHLGTTFDGEVADIFGNDKVGGIIGNANGGNALSNEYVNDTISNCIVAYTSANLYLETKSYSQLGAMLTCGTTDLPIVFHSYFMGKLEGDVTFSTGGTVGYLSVGNNNNAIFGEYYSLYKENNESEIKLGYTQGLNYNTTPAVNHYWGLSDELNGGYIYVSTDESGKNPTFEIAPTSVSVTAKDALKIDDKDDFIGLNYYDFKFSAQDELLTSLNENFNTKNILDLFTFNATPSSIKKLTLIVSSSNPNVVNVTYDGKIILKGVGKCVLTFRSALNPGVSASVQVNVTAPLGEFKLSQSAVGSHFDVAGKDVQIAKNTSEQFYIISSGSVEYGDTTYDYVTTDQVNLEVKVKIEKNNLNGENITDFISISGQNGVESDYNEDDKVYRILTVKLDYLTPFSISAKKHLFNGSGEPIPFEVQVKPYMVANYNQNEHIEIFYKENAVEDVCVTFNVKLYEGVTKLDLNYNSAILYPNDKTIISVVMATDVKIKNEDISITIERLKNDGTIEDVSTNISLLTDGSLIDGKQTNEYNLLIKDKLSDITSKENWIVTFSVADLTNSVTYTVLPQRINKIEIKNYIYLSKSSDDYELELNNVLQQGKPGLVILDVTPDNGYFDYLEIKDISGSEEILFIQIDGENGTTLKEIDEPTEDGKGIKLTKDYTHYTSGRLYVYTQTGLNGSSKIHTIEVRAYAYDSNGVAYEVTETPNYYDIDVRMLPKINVSYKNREYSTTNENDEYTDYIANGTDLEFYITTENSDGEVEYELTTSSHYEFVQDYNNFYVLKSTGYDTSDINETVTLTLSTYAYVSNGQFNKASITITFTIVNFVVYDISVTPCIKNDNKIYGTIGVETALEFYFDEDDVTFYNNGKGFEGLTKDDNVAAGSTLAKIKAILTTLNDDVSSGSKNQYLSILPEPEDDKIILQTKEIVVNSVTKKQITLLVKKDYNVRSKLNVALKLELLDNGDWEINSTGTTPLYKSFNISFVEATASYEAKLVKNETDFLNMTSGEVRYILGADLEFENYSPLDLKIIEFDGNGRTITIRSFANFTDEEIQVGLFKQVYEGMTVKNVVVNYKTKFDTEYRVHTLGKATQNSSNTDYDDIEYFDLCNDETVNYSSALFGGLAAVNNGIITNCEVKGEIAMRASVIEEKGQESSGQYTINFNVGGLVGENTETGYVTNSTNNLAIFAQANIGGFVYSNAGKISSCAVESDAKIYSYNNLLERTIVVQIAGFAITNSNFISMSYVNLTMSNGIGNFAPKDLSAGFVFTNSKTIKNCYANVMVTHKSNAMAGFVQSNTGSISTTYSIINNGQWLNSVDSMFAPSRTHGLTDCVEIVDVGTSYVQNSSDGLTTLTLDKKFTKSEYEACNFIFGDNKNAVWQMDPGSLPALSSTLEKVEYLATGDDREPTTSDGATYYKGLQTIKYSKEIEDNVEVEKSEIISGSYGIKNNPYIITNYEDWKYYFVLDGNGICSHYYRIVADIDFGAINDNPSTSTMVFNGNIQGNDMVLKDIMLYSNADNLEAIGLFKSIESLGDLNVTSAIRNLTLTSSSVWAAKVQAVGILAGIIQDYEIYNITLNSNNVVVVGGNAVGGLAGLIRGNFDLDGISSNIGANSTRASSLYKYSVYLSKTNGESSSNIANVYYAGSIAGIVDAYNSSSFSLVNRASARYSSIKNIFVHQDIVVMGDSVGVAFGMINEKTHIDKVKIDLTSGAISGVQYSGGVVGENRGIITNAIVDFATDNMFRNSTYVSAGIAGLNLGGLIDSVQVNGSVMSSSILTTVGGIVGRNINGVITNCIVNCKLQGYFVGGFIGSNYKHSTLLSASTGTGALAEECRENGRLLPKSQVNYGDDVVNLSNLKITATAFSYLYANRAYYYTYIKNPTDFTFNTIFNARRVLGFVIGLTDIDISYTTDDILNIGFNTSGDFCVNTNLLQIGKTTSTTESTYLNVDNYKLVVSKSGEAIDGLVKIIDKDDVDSYIYELGINNLPNVVKTEIKSYGYTNINNEILFLNGAKVTNLDAWESYSYKTDDNNNMLFVLTNQD